MIESLHVALIAISGVILALALLLILKRCLSRRKTAQNIGVSDTERGQASLQSGIARLHQVSPHHHHLDVEKPNYYQLFRRGSSAKPPPFSWSDHPSLVTDAVENGWSRFAFAMLAPPSPSVKASILGAFAGANETTVPNMEMGWEVCEDSADFMQKIRLNPNLTAKKTVSAVIRAGLPLPGPNLGNSSFPQEAYFEITIPALFGNASVDHELEKKGRLEGDKIKLIDEDFNAKNSPDVLVSSHVVSQRRSKVDRAEGVLLCVGLAGLGGTLTLRIPGSYSGSVGFNSTGSVFLDGTKIFPETEKHEWAVPDKVIGCGYSPLLKKVFFTVDAQLVQEIHCKTEEFGSPLYPTIASNADATVLVNLGQSQFKYGPANVRRTPNPCFVSPLGSSPALGYDEDSRELFSMGRIDAHWLRSATRSNNNTVNSIRSLEYDDQESEGELFEIVLDGTGRSPYAASVHQQ